MDTLDNAFALSIGVGGDLPVTITDATAIAKLLQDPARCAYPADHVRLLTGPQATRDGILNGLGWLAAATHDVEDPAVIVYFSGHGSKDHALQAFRGAGDTSITSAELTAHLAAVKAKRLLVLLDCCYAAGVWNTAHEAWQKKSSVDTDVVKALGTGSGHTAIASSRRDETSFVGAPYSAFTTALIEALSGEGVSTRDGFVRVSDVVQWVSRRVPELTNDKQHPDVDWTSSDNFRLARYGAGALETRGVPDWVEARARQPLSELMTYPPGPLVPATWMPDAVVDVYAELYSTFETASRIVNRANKWLLKEHSDATILSAGRLLNIGKVEAGEYWYHAFTEARKHGPRMMAALLLSTKEDLFPEAARKERDDLLRRMRDELR
jgi:hypothetical protein